MRSLVSGLWLSVSAGLMAWTGLQADGCGAGEEPSSRLLVGMEVTTILPEVAGSTTYFDPVRSSPLALDPADPGLNPGVFVEGFDVGTLAVGNGYPSSHWVHDELRAGAVAFQSLDDPTGQVIVMATVDVYMLFRQDIQSIYDAVARKVGPARFEQLRITVSATHNHMGPDTSGLEGINRAYYAYLIEQVANVIVDASDAAHLKPAYLKVARAQHQFGMGDTMAPRIVDPTLNVLQAVSTDDGQVIGTLVQWQNHPEDVLWFGRDVYASEDEAAYLRSVDECYSDDNQAHCYVEGQYLSAGFPGYAMKYIMDATAAPALYVNGPVGAMISPLNTVVWETEGASGKPAGDGVVVPEGAVLLDKNFRRLAVTGLELGKAALQALEGAEEVYDPAIQTASRSFFTRLSNWGFRLGLVVRKNGEPLMLGYNKRDLFNCPAVGVKDASTCVSDGYESVQDPILQVPIRKGDHIQSEVHYTRIGPIGFMTVPGEAVVELVEGLPSDFYADPRQTYYAGAEDPQDHLRGTAYQTPGYIRQVMADRYQFVLGLTQDEIGYLIPLSDWRVFCVADEETFGGTPGTCAALNAAGIMDYRAADGSNYSISGSRCKQILEDPAVLNGPPYNLVPNGAQFAQFSCGYGQAFGEASGHYCETMGTSWDVADDYVSCVKALTGFSGTLEQVNPSFVGKNAPAP